MAILCDTATVPARDRAELWVEVVSELFVPLECVPHHGAAFHGRLRAGSLGPIRMCGMEVGPHTVKRTPRLAANTQGDQYKLSLILGGAALIVQDAREAVLGPGDFAIYDCTRPYTFVANDPFRMLACLVPRDIIGFSPARVSEITATRIPSGNGIGWAMVPFLKRLADLAVRDEVPPDEHRVVESVVDLVGSLCATVMTEDACPHAQSRAELVLRIRAYIDSHLGEPDLTPTRIAAAHFISKRYLHKLFEAEGVSVSRWIRERRLEHCRSALADPRWRDETVTSIGMRWGFTDPAHFSRLFRETYGCTPTEYRRLDLPIAS
jgi:AraC-like DNA-binding protein